MKAKEWIRALVPLAQDETKAEEFMDEVSKFQQECVSIFKTRVSNLDDACRKGSDDRLVGAFREAAVKWDAVVHGVQTQVGPDAALFPLLRGALIMPHLVALLEDLQHGKIEHDKARAMQQFLTYAAKQLGWDQYKYIAAVLDMISVHMHKGASEQVQSYIDSLQRYHALKDKQFGAIPLTPGERDSLQTLEQWLINHQPGMKVEFDSLPPHRKLAAMARMGSIFA